MIGPWRNRLIQKLKSRTGLWGVIRRVLYAVLYYSGVPFFLREWIQRHKVTILLYHNIEPSLFERHLRAFQRRYHIISFKDFLGAQKNPQTPLPPKALIITFDDGFKNNYFLLPVIQRYAVPVTIFLCSSIVDSRRKFWVGNPVAGCTISQLRKIPNEQRLSLMQQCGFEETREYAERTALNGEEIREMASWVDFQPHTRFHPSLPQCDDARARDEIQGSKVELMEKFGLDVYAFAYPFGDYSDRDIQLIQEAGYEAAITTDHYFNMLSTDPYRLRRLGIPDAAGVHEALVNASGFKIFLRRLVGGLDYGYTMR